MQLYLYLKLFTALPALIAESRLPHTETREENIAVMSVIWRLDSEKVTAMNDADFEREKAYQTTMPLVRQLRKNGSVTDEEYRKIDTIMLEK